MKKGYSPEHVAILRRAVDAKLRQWDAIRDPEAMTDLQAGF